MRVVVSLISELLIVDSSEWVGVGVYLSLENVKQSTTVFSLSLLFFALSV
jgi:hypothetical protein